MREGCWEGPVMEPEPPPPNPHIYTEFTIPGDPLVYSLKYPVGERTREMNYFRNRAWYSPLKCVFKQARNRNEPMVLFVRFYVPPIAGHKIRPRDIASEKVPAVHAWEVLDFTLSFLEMLKGSLILTYRQLVKIDCEKFYSKNPRTVFKFMSYTAYDAIQHNHSLYPETKGQCQTWEKRVLQSKLPRYGQNRRARPKKPDVRGTIERAVAYYSALRTPSPETRIRRSKKAKTSTAALLKARSRQFRKVLIRRPKKRRLGR